jgi:hypothetical protein
MNKTAIVSNSEFVGLLGNFTARGIAYSWSEDDKSVIATVTIQWGNGTTLAQESEEK